MLFRIKLINFYNKIYYFLRNVFIYKSLPKLKSINPAEFFIFILIRVTRTNQNEIVNAADAIFDFFLSGSGNIWKIFTALFLS